MGSNGGETGIRTLGGLAPTTVFETAPFDHSGTSPRLIGVIINLSMRAKNSFQAETAWLIPPIELAAARCVSMTELSNRNCYINRSGPHCYHNSLISGCQTKQLTYEARTNAATHLIQHSNPSSVSLVHSYPVILWELDLKTEDCPITHAKGRE